MTPIAGSPDWNARRRKALADSLLADFLKALKKPPSRPLSPPLGSIPTGVPVIPPRAAEPPAAMTGYVLAWRQWGVVSHRGGTLRLTALTQRAIWPPRGRLVAECPAGQVQQHLPPEPGCSCGIYAVKNGSEFHPHMLRSNIVWRGSAESVPWVVGKVALWGRVLEFTDGFRAQYAYPYVLWSAGLTAGERIALGDAYGVEVYELDGDVLKTMGRGGNEFVE